MTAEGSKTVWELWQEDIQDDTRRTSLIELSGEASAGKSQLILQLLLQARLPMDRGGLDGRSFVLLTEGDLPTNRLNQLAEHICEREALPGWTPQKLLNGIILKRVRSLPEQENILRFQLSQLFRAAPKKGLRKEKPVRLVVVDSISHLYRGGDRKSGNPGQFNPSQQKSLVDCAAELKTLAGKHRIVVIVVNQVTDFFLDGKQLHHHLWSRKSSGRFVHPSLGLRWAESISSRILLTRDFGMRNVQIPNCVGQPEENSTSREMKRQKLSPSASRAAAVLAGSAGSGSRMIQTTPRTFHIVFSAFWPTVSFPIALTQEGVAAVLE